jgi:hypothetical protein
LVKLGVSLETGSLETLAHNPILGRHIEPHHILLSLPDPKTMCPCCNTSHALNGSLTKVDQELADFFRGPILALGSYCEAAPSKKGSDLDLGPADFRHIVDNLRLIYCHCEDDTRDLLNGRDIRAVRLNCLGDTEFTKRPTLEAVFEPKSVLLADTGIPTPVADNIGMPLIVRKVPPAVIWRDPCRPCRINNLNAGMLNSPHQPENTGSLVFVRKDGKPLHPMHVEALFAYTAIRLQDPDHPKDACLTAEMLQTGRIDKVSKEDFRQWYSTKWQTHSPEATFMRSPFEIDDAFEDKDTDTNMNHKS